MDTKQHRFGGWPGAYCLDCGAADPIEEAIGHGCDDIFCTICGKSYPTGLDRCIDGVEKKLQQEPDSDLGDYEQLWYYPHEIQYKDCGMHGKFECKA